jgi:hypothetical protein
MLKAALAIAFLYFNLTRTFALLVTTYCDFYMRGQQTSQQLMWTLALPPKMDTPDEKPNNNTIMVIIKLLYILILF